MTKRVLSFGTHPDDIEIGCGGTELRLIEKGYQVTHVCVTSGESGSQTLSREELRATREREAIAAAEVMGISDVRFMGFEDGLTEYTRSMKLEVVDVIRSIRPGIIFTHSPQDNFPQHQVVSKLIHNAIIHASGPWYQETREKPWDTPVVLGYEVWFPLNKWQTAVDITDTIEKKLKALACHESQIEDVRYDEAFGGLARYRGEMTFASKYAEAFEIIKMDGESLLNSL
ncbi:MAG: PIG-L deacetylase family protein [Acidobacteriota bacterium]